MLLTKEEFLSHFEDYLKTINISIKLISQYLSMDSASKVKINAPSKLIKSMISSVKQTKKLEREKQKVVLFAVP